MYVFEAPITACHSCKKQEWVPRCAVCSNIGFLNVRRSCEMDSCATGRGPTTRGPALGTFHHRRGDSPQMGVGGMAMDPEI